MGEGYRQNLVCRGGGVAAKWHLREMMVGGKVGPGLGGMGDSESGLAILLNCENSVQIKTRCQV